MFPTKDEAVAAGEKYFFTGKPCKHGHVVERYVGNGGCVQCLRPKSPTQLAVIPEPRGEILVPSSDRTELQRTRIEIQRQGLELRKFRLEQRQHEITFMREEREQKRTEMLALRDQLESEMETRRIERAERKVRQSTVKSELVDVYVVADPLDYQGVSNLVWCHAVMREPLLRLEDVVTGRGLKDCRYIMKCFPEDKKEILRLCWEIFNRRNQVTPAEIDQKLLAARAVLDAEAEDNGQPEGDPR